MPSRRICRCLTAFEAVGISKGLALGIKSFGGFGSRHEGVWSFVDVWDQGEHPNVVFILEGSFWCNRIMALQRAAAVAAASSSTG